MQPKEVINILKEFGLGEYEAKAYLALLERGKISARVISEVTRIPYTKIYQVLQNLERYGFIVSISGKPRKHVAVSPEKALEKKMTQIKKKHEEEEKKRKNLKKKLVNELKPLFESNVEDIMTETGTRTIIGSVNVTSHIKNVILDSTVLRCTISDLEAFMEAYNEEINSTDAEIIIRAPNARPLDNISVYHYPSYEGSDILIKDDDEAVYTFFVASPGVFTFSEMKVRVVADKKFVTGLIKDFDLSLNFLEEVTG